MKIYYFFYLHFGPPTFHNNEITNVAIDPVTPKTLIINI